MESIDQEFWIDYLKFSSDSNTKTENIQNFQIVEKNLNTPFNQKPESACLADVDRDGDVDLFVVNQVHQNYIRLNNGNGKFGDIQMLYNDSTSNKNNHALFVDINDDGWLDLFEGRELNYNQLFTNKGNNIFSANENPICNNDMITNTYATLWADFDTNGYLDFIDVFPNCMAVTKSGFRLIMNKESQFTCDVFPGDIPFFGGAIADVNNDNTCELFLANANGKNAIYEISPELKYTELPIEIFNDTPFPNRIHEKYKGYGRSEGGIFSDFDNDGDLDLYVCNDGAENQFYIWDEGKFTEEADVRNMADSLKSEGFLVADFDNDMDWDIYLLHTFTQNQLMLNNGKGYFYDGTTGSGLEDPGGAMGAACGDIDNDGDIDICLTDPYRGMRILYNSTNNSNFVKVDLRGQPGNYYGIRAKVFIISENNQQLACYHQTTCGDGFQYEAFSKQFHFGLHSGQSYKVRVEFSDRVEFIQDHVESGQTITAIYPSSNSILNLYKSFLFKIHEPFLAWLRASSLIYTLIILILFGIIINGIKQTLLLNKFKRFIFALIFVLIIYFAFYDFKTLSIWITVIVFVFVSYSSELIISPIRKFLHRHYVRENTWDHLFDHLKAFHHGGVAINNMDRLIFLFQNLKEYHGEFVQYQKRIQDAVQVFVNQTSWQLTELLYILKDIHWDRGSISSIKRNHSNTLKLINLLIKKSYTRSKYEELNKEIVDGIRFLENNIKKIYQRILPHFQCNTSEIISQVYKTKFSKYPITIDSNDNNQIIALIKGYELGNIISDLIENGIRANLAGEYKGSINIHPENEILIIDVTDNGKGIPKANQKKIFKKGFTTVEAGSGFGLFYAKETLARYNGQIKILRTEKNNGTTMRIILKTVKGYKEKGIGLLQN